MAQYMQKKVEFVYEKCININVSRKDIEYIKEKEKKRTIRKYYQNVFW